MKPELSIVFSCYGQPDMLREWFRAYEQQDGLSRSLTEVVVVDDCGTPVADPPSYATLLRVQRDIPWNQPGARNLGALQAKAETLLLIDVDMTLPPGRLAGLLEAVKLMPKKAVWQPSLRHITNAGAPVEKFDDTSPNVYLIRREQFWKSCGYDEDYCGHKGWSDCKLQNVLGAMFTLRKVKSLWLWLHHSGNIKDAQVKTLDRSVAHNKKFHVRDNAVAKKKGWIRVAQAQGEIVRFLWTKVR